MDSSPQVAGQGCYIPAWIDADEGVTKGEELEEATKWVRFGSFPSFLILLCIWCGVVILHRSEA